MNLFRYLAFLGSRRRHHFAVVACACFGISLSSPPAAAQQVVLRAVKTDTLSERPGRELAKPLDMEIAPDGTLVIADGFNEGLLLIDTQQGEARWLTRLPLGRGRLAAIGGILAVTEDAVWYYDYGGRDVVRVDWNGTETVRHRYEGRLTGGTLTGADSLSLALLDLSAGLSIATLSGEVRSSPLRADRGRIMPSYLQSRELASVFDLVHLVPIENGFITGYSGTSELMLLDRAGSVQRIGRIPDEGRPSISSTMWPRLRQDRVPYAELIGSVAPMRLLQQLHAEEMIAVHLGLEHRDGENFGSAFWVSLVSSDLTAVCTGSRMEFGGVGQPVFAVRGDTLVSVQRSAVGADFQTVVKRWLVEPGDCEWQPLSSPLHEREPSN